jgi:hypothetical protein
MILRSVIRHVRDQNWFAVGLDFLIVVVGVFIGIQVANWNDLRRERLEEAAIVARLQVEVDALIDVQRAELADTEARAMRLLPVQPVQPVLFGQEPIRALALGECQAIMSSHIYPRPTDRIPVLTEIRETGRFDLIRDQVLRSRLRDYILLQERTRGHFEEISNELFRLHSRHPEVLTVQRVPLEPDADRAWTALSGEGYRWDPICRVQAMRDSPAFLNEYVDNLSRNNSFMRMYRERIGSLESIRERLRAPVSGSGIGDERR